MEDEIKKITYKDVYDILKFDMPMENLVPITGIIPEKILNIIKAQYNLAITMDDLDMTFEEFIGSVLLSTVKNGIKT